MIENKIKKEIKLLISLFEELISQEEFNAYIRLKNKYMIVLGEIINKEKSNITEVDFKEIQSSFRIFLEAPPKDKDIGRKILDQMQAIYEIQQEILGVDG